MCSDFPAYSYSIMLCKNYRFAVTGSMQADYYGPAFQSTPIKLLTLPITYFFHPPPPRLFSFFLTSIFTQTCKLCISSLALRTTTGNWKKSTLDILIIQASLTFLLIPIHYEPGLGKKFPLTLISYVHPCLFCPPFPGITLILKNS